ncbi:hypothetical protein E4U56_002502 [Claviceps arundinis]|uniref:non-specific serine/threonine protein kinase n=1 Tax=Claviceps arundinis TaxID=1623583 RepID=A0A9P7MQH5_9HYPO|nr:hypothetical protein E4U56_002502 [Claviceps arundinis]
MAHTLKIGSWLSRSFLSRHAANKAVFSSSGFTTRVGFNCIQSRNSTTSVPPVEYESVEGVEDISQYRLGRYHPIHIDDRLNNRYRVVHKLGYGSFSTVWLALDEKTPKYVAMKVGTTDTSRSEIGTISQITQNALLFPTVLDRFDIIGPNGTHPCLVTSPARCSLRDSQDEGFFFGLFGFPLDVARSFAAQLVIALSIVHKRGFAHGGELLSKFRELSRNNYTNSTVTREPDKEPVVCLKPEAASKHPSVPSYVVSSAWLGIPSGCVKLAEAKLVLGDFGAAFRPYEESQDGSHTTDLMRPPESRFDPKRPLTFASDIWSLGYAIFDLLAPREILNEFCERNENILYDRILGRGRSFYIDKEVKVIYTTVDDVVRSLEVQRQFRKRVRDSRHEWKMDRFAEDENHEIKALIKLLRCMLAFEPSERPDISQVLQSEWMTKWALPAYQKGLEE